MNREEINTLWMNELSAIEAYQGTLGAKEWKLGDGDPEIDELFHILVDHVQAASLLGRTLDRLKRLPSVSELKPQGKWSEFGTLAGWTVSRCQCIWRCGGVRDSKGGRGVQP